jgi:antitoxin component of MazEF toxin-antitoxin module
VKFTLHKARKDCLIPTSARGVAGLKREKELRLEVENGVIVILRPDLNAKKLLAVSTFLRGLSSDMIAAVAKASGGCICCGDCGGEDCECDSCEYRERCRGIELPHCLLKQAGITTGQPWKAEAGDGAVTIRAMPEDKSDDAAIADNLSDSIPEAVRLAFKEAGVCSARLEELLCSNDPISF